MNLTKNQKILLGILHFLPIIGGIYLVSNILTAFSSLGTDGNMNSNMLAESIPSITIIAIIISILSLIVLIFDIIHLVKSNKNDKNNKIVIWILVLLFFQGISNLIYYFVEILPEKKEIQ